MRKIRQLDKYLKTCIKFYKNGWSINKIADKYNVSQWVVRGLFERNNFPLRKPGDTLKLPIDDYFFDDINTENKAYWLGFLMTDGNVCGTMIGMSLCLKDLTHIQKYKKVLRSKHKIYCEHAFDRRTGSTHHKCSLKFRSPHMVTSLQKWGVIPRKTSFETLPILSHDLIRHFIRGAIDGDGCISSHLPKSGKTPLYQIYLCSSSQRFIQQVSTYINWIFGKVLGRISTVKSTGHKTMYYLHYGGNQQAYKISHWLYSDCKTKLTRKYKRYLKLCKVVNKSS